MDIGTPERYLQASWDILEGRSGPRVEPTAPGVLVAAARRGRAPMRWSGRAPSSPPGCRVGAGAEIRESVLLDGSVVGEGARVSGSILAPGAEVGPELTVEGAVRRPAREGASG